MSENQKNKEKLIRVAIELFSTKGFKGTAIRDIARAMDMSISNIYHYFGNKEGLLLAILEHSSKILLDKLHEVSQMELEPFERFKKLVKTHIELSDYYKKEVKIFFLDEEHLSEEGEEINSKIQKGILQIYCNELKALKASGILNCDHITIMALNILGTINWHLRWYRTGGSLSIEQVTDEILSFILYGVVGSRGAG